MNKLSQPRPEILTFSNRALNRIKALLKDAPKEAMGVRFGIKTGGCSGMTPMDARREARKRTRLSRSVGRYALGMFPPRW